MAEKGVGTARRGAFTLQSLERVYHINIAFPESLAATWDLQKYQIYITTPILLEKNYSGVPRCS